MIGIITTRVVAQLVVRTAIVEITRSAVRGGMNKIGNKIGDVKESRGIKKSSKKDDQMIDVVFDSIIEESI